MFGDISHIRWHIGEDNRTGSDDGVIADVDRPEDDRTGADLDVVADDGPSFFCCLLSDSYIRSEGAVVANSGTVSNGDPVRMPEFSGSRELPTIHITGEETKRKTLVDAPVCVYRGIDDMIADKI